MKPWSAEKQSASLPAKPCGEPELPSDLIRADSIGPAMRLCLCLAGAVIVAASWAVVGPLLPYLVRLLNWR